MTPLSIVLLVGGVIALVLGAEALVRGATRIAARTGLSTVVIGLTVVAFGTSAPELAVSVGDVVRGGDEAGGIALGNVVGSNIANILLALGISAAVGGSLVVARRIIRIDVPVMVGASVLVLLMSLNGEIDRLEGFVLVALLVVYVTWTVVAARRGNNDIPLDLNDDLSDEALAEAPVWRDLEASATWRWATRSARTCSICSQCWASRLRSRRTSSRLRRVRSKSTSPS